MIEKTIHIGPALSTGMGTVLQGYVRLLGLPKKNLWNSHYKNFVMSLPALFKICFKILFTRQKDIICYQIHTASFASIIRKLLIVLCLKIKRKKAVIHLHGSEFVKSRFQIMLLKILINVSDAVICISEQMKFFLEKENVKSKIFVIPNLSETIAENPIDLENRNGPVNIVFSGNCTKIKGVFDLLEAFENTNLSVPAKLDFYGSGELQKMNEYIENFTKKNSINILGFTKHCDLIKKLSGYDLLVLPSYTEVFPMSILEAMGFGIPVISTYIGGIPEMVDNGKNGILFKAGNVNELTKALEKLINDKELRINMGKNAWLCAKSKFSPEIVLKKLEEMYKQTAFLNGK